MKKKLLSGIILSLLCTALCSTALASPLSIQHSHEDPIVAALAKADSSSSGTIKIIRFIKNSEQKNTQALLEKQQELLIIPCHVTINNNGCIVDINSDSTGAMFSDEEIKAFTTISFSNALALISKGLYNIGDGTISLCAGCIILVIRGSEVAFTLSKACVKALKQAQSFCSDYAYVKEIVANKPA